MVDDNGKYYGIELEYPRGTGLLESKFKAHIENDIRKLNEEARLSERYLIIVAYNDPPFKMGPYFYGLEERLGHVNLAYLRLAKANEDGRVNPLLNGYFFPKGWRPLVG